MRLLLLSNSTNPGEPYLQYALPRLGAFLEGVEQAVFIPWAAVRISWDDYAQRVRERFQTFGCEVVSVHEVPFPLSLIETAQAIVVGGGNTFQLVRRMQEEEVMDLVRERVGAGVPFVGWSAGSNVACPTLCTTNDMPVVEPRSFETLGLVPFQINPHYTDARMEGHGGETRDERIAEYIEVNAGVNVVGLREGTLLSVEDERVRLEGPRAARLFRKGSEPRDLKAGDDLGFLLETGE